MMLEEKQMTIEAPLIIMFKQSDGSGNVVTHLFPPDGYTHQTYGLMICDLVRHVANAFKVDEDDVWEWVDKERDHHSTEIKRAS